VRRSLFTSSSGIRHEWEDAGNGDAVVHSQFDSQPILEHNKVLATANDGYSPTRELRRVASIPLALIYKWKVEEGWDALDPACADKLRQKLNSSEYLYLRTAPGRL
jgi:hypothetical protein